MAEVSIPVDLFNPGQVFACIGFMEATELLCGPCESRFDYARSGASAKFTLRVDGDKDPVRETLAFLTRSEVLAIAPLNSDLTTRTWNVRTKQCPDTMFPCAAPDTPATLPVWITDGERRIPIEHWADGSSRDTVKFWAGAGGYPGAALARDALELVRFGDNELTVATGDPFSVSAPQSSSFRFDWRRDYIPLDAGFSPNDHTSTITMVGYPFVELLAAIGLQHARPARPELRDKLVYRYGVSTALLPTAFARAVLGCESLGFPIRTFRMRLGWPGQEGQARCIIDAQEEQNK